MTARAATGGTSGKAKAATQGKQGKKKHYTAAQNRQMRAYFRHHHTPKKKPKKVARRGAPLAVEVEPGYWIAGDNDTMPSCVAVAVANAILAQTGHRATPDELQALHVACSAIDGAFIPDALNAITQKESE